MLTYNTKKFTVLKHEENTHNSYAITSAVN